jgi:putative heme-binding domain-containing protein
VFGHEYRDNLFLCQFNLRKVSRHILKPAGATYTTQDSDFVWSDFVDFHPTDVLVDADGSLLVLDTGGWYKLCCPTSQLWKPDVVGGIYRVRKIGARVPADPRGKKIDWAKQTPSELWSHLADERSVVRQRATRELVHRKGTHEAKAFVADLLANLPPGLEADSERRQPREVIDRTSSETTAAIARTWALSQIDSPQSRKMIRDYFLTNGTEPVQHAAVQSVGLYRDAEATAELARIETIERKKPALCRIAAEGLGRIGGRNSEIYVLGLANQGSDRVLQHSVIYALIEIDDPETVRGSYGLASRYPKIQAAALIALDQMPGGAIRSAEVIPHLGASDETLREAARWVVAQHADWGGELAQWLDGQLKALPSQTTHAKSEASSDDPLQSMLVTFAAHPAVQQLLANAIVQNGSPTARALALRVMTGSRLPAPPKPWVAAIAAAIAGADDGQLPLAIAAARRFPLATAGDPKASQALVVIAAEKRYPLELRVEALAILVGKRPKISDEQFDLLVKSLSADTPVVTRSAAADAIAKAHLSPKQLDALCTVIESASPLELNRLFKPFDQSTDDTLGLKLVASLKKTPSVSSVRLNLLREALAKYGPNVQQKIAELESIVNVDAAAQRKRIEELLPLVSKGDVRRGHAVFYSSKATCSACHRLGYAGGTTGPELTHVGKTRTERDILESILFPSLSFVRSYEPVLITTQDGKVINGIIKDENAKEYVVATGPDQLTRIAHDDVDQIQPSTVSIMPAGLDKQLTGQELADLVAFLKNGAGH